MIFVVTNPITYETHYFFSGNEKAKGHWPDHHIS